MRALAPVRGRARDPRLVRLDRLSERVLPGGLRLAEATGARARLLGLARLRTLPRGRALRIPRCRSVHTFGMRFPLDLVWLDGHGAVVGLSRGVAPRRVVSCRRARSVIEARAGEGRAFAAAVAVAAREAHELSSV